MNESAKLANFWLRFLASVIDFKIFFLPFLLTFLITTSQKSVLALLTSLLSLLGFVLIPLLILGSLINVLLIYYLGASLGKLITGLAIVTTGGGKLSFLRILFRQTVGLSFSTTFFGLGFLNIFWDPKKQAWHDKTVGSIVIIKQPIWFIGLLILIAITLTEYLLISSGIKNFINNVPLKNELIHLIVYYKQDTTDQNYAQKEASRAANIEDFKKSIERSLQEKNYQKALEDAQKAVAKDPDDPEIYYQIGTILLNLGEKEKALAQFQKATELDPKNKLYQDALFKLK